MRYKILVMLLILASMTIVACGTNGRYQLTLFTEGEHILSGPLQGDIVILNGDVLLEESADLEGSVHLLSGNLQVNGEIRGNISAFGGHLALGPQAYVAGTINYGGGDLSLSEGAVIDEGVYSGSGIQIPALAPSPQHNPALLILRWLLASLIPGILAVFVQRYFPQPVKRVAEAMLQHVIISAAMGFLVGIVGLTLIVLLAYTILLIPIAILGFLLMGAAVMGGWIASGIILGEYLAKLLKFPIRPSVSAFIGVTLLLLLLNILTSIQIVGGMLALALAVIGLGAMFLTRFGLRRFIPEDLMDTSS